MLKRFSLLISLLISILIFSCSKTPIEQKNKVSIGFLIIGEYKEFQYYPHIQNAIRKQFLKSIPYIKRPISFTFIDWKMAEDLAKKKKFKHSNFNNIKNCKDFCNSLNADIVLFIQPKILKTKEIYIDDFGKKCTKKLGYAYFYVKAYRTDNFKTILDREFKVNYEKQKCDEEVYPNIDNITEKDIQTYLLDELFMRVSRNIIGIF